MGALKVRRIRLLGVGRDYEVSFLDNEGEVASLAIIAGQISTGKTSVLEFITYCLGARDFPHHPEIRSRVGKALLECEMQGSTFVIERSASEIPSKTAVIHSCDLEGLGQSHPSRETVIAPNNDPESLSQYLLTQFGLGNVLLKEAPTKDASGVDRLSIRDVLKLMIIENSNLDDKNLLYENSQPVVRLKHEQVLDLMFGAHDNTAASLAAEAKSLEYDINERSLELRTIDAFMSEQKVPAIDVINSRVISLHSEKSDLESSLDTIEHQMAAEAAFGDEQRLVYQEAGAKARELSNRQRETRTQLERLSALAAQYDQDIKKLVFAKEAKRIFDPLAIQICPWCLQEVDASISSSTESCKVCHQPLSDIEDNFDVDREINASRRRHKELAELLDEMRSEDAEISLGLDAAIAGQKHAQSSFDAVMQGRFSPFMAERDEILASMNRVEHSLEQFLQLTTMQNSRDRRWKELANLRQSLADLRDAQHSADLRNVTRAQVIDSLNSRFGSILSDFHFPKLSEPSLDLRYIPSVRGLRYDLIGSSGAMTLISLAWYLSVFEVSTEAGGAHPGLLMIDSPQKNLLPATDQLADEYQGPAIAQGVYNHIANWCGGTNGSGQQVIIVDNDPPPQVERFVVARFSGDNRHPPYGLIDDATN